MNESLAVLEKLLQFHDWYFDYSDDYSAWKKGMAERDAINQEQKRLIINELATTEEIQELTNKYAPKGI
jgi:hypothetical protein